MRVVICGSREWDDADAIRAIVDMLPKYTEVIVGGARGVDQMAEAAARIRGYDVHVEKALWETEGRAAGPIRNGRMLDMRPDLVIAFWIGASPGTRHIVRETMRRKIPLQLHWRPMK